MGITDDPNDPGLKDIGEDGMQRSYLVLSDAERAMGFVRPLRRSYVHVGIRGPVYPLRDLTEEERGRHDGAGYVKFERFLRNVDASAGYPPYDGPESAVGRLWTQAQLDSVGKGCGTVTTMAQAIAETYARNPTFYGGTFCAGCGTHFPVGEPGEFVWDGTDERVGT